MSKPKTDKKIKEKDHPDVEYLKKDQIGDVIASGLSLLYEVQPPNPVDYLAKWLLNYTKQNEIKKEFSEKEKRKTELFRKLNEAKKEEEKKEAVKKKKETVVENTKKNFEDLVKRSDDLVDIFDDTCEHIKEITKSTGVYIGKLEQQKKPISEDDNDQAHIDESAPYIIHYISADKTHKDLIDKTLKIEDGITYDVFKEKKEIKEDELQEEGDPGPAKEENGPEYDLNCVFVKEVVREPRMKFFRVPKLGSYFAVPLQYNSCLFESALDSAIEQYGIYLEKKEDEENKKREHEQMVEAAKEDAERRGAEYEPIEEPVWENPEEPSYQNVLISYVVCLDTLGQDREFTEDEKIYVIETVKMMKEHWEKMEIERLTKDKLQRVDEVKKDQDFESSELQALNESEFQHVEETVGAMEKGEMTEEEIKFEEDFTKMTYYAKQLLEGPFSEKLLKMTSLNVIKMPRIFQSAFYLLGYDKKQICAPDTNKLVWKKAKKMITKDFLKKIQDYTPKGPKTGEYPPYRLINFIDKNLAGIEQEEVDKYSMGLGKLFKWLFLAVDLRKRDVLYRKNKREQQRESIQEALRRKEEYDTNRKQNLENAIEEAKANWVPPEPPEPNSEAEEENEEKPSMEFRFDEESFLQQWDSENPPVEIPPDVIEEVDNDYIYE